MRSPAAWSVLLASCALACAVQSPPSDLDTDDVSSTDDTDIESDTETVDTPDDDADDDGTPAPLDCDDEDPLSTVRSTDADCDGTITAEDCDDENPAAALTEDDVDCDGAPKRYDCNDLLPTSPTSDVDPDCDGTPGFTMQRIAGSTFEMGCIPDVTTCEEKEVPAHTVTVSYDVMMMTTEVTQSHFHAVMGYNPTAFPACGPRCPIETVSWHEAVAFANALSAAEGLESCYTCTGRDLWIGCVEAVPPTTCLGYRLPTEAEWENAARCGTNTAYAGSDFENLVSWYRANSGNRTRTVAQKPANTCGLHDMSGNVFEWMNDWYAPYSEEAQVDPTGPADGATKVGRSGGYDCSHLLTQVTARDGQAAPADRYPVLGFRLVKRAPPP